MNKKILVPTMLVVTLIAVSVLSVSVVSAQNAATTLPLVEKIAQKFGLNKDEVQGVFDEYRDEKQADMYAKFAEHLNDMVLDGKITSEQRKAILDKHEEIQAKMEGFKDLTPEERRTKMKEVHDEMTTWMKDNGIDFPVMGMGMGIHPNKMFGNGEFRGHLN